jgi:hypothetical protein
MQMLLLLCVAAQLRREGYSWGGVTGTEHTSRCILGCSLPLSLSQLSLGVPTASIVGGMGFLSVHQLAVTACWHRRYITPFRVFLVEVAAPAPRTTDRLLAVTACWHRRYISPFRIFLVEVAASAPHTTERLLAVAACRHRRYITHFRVFLVEVAAPAPRTTERLLAVAACWHRRYITHFRVFLVEVDAPAPHTTERLLAVSPDLVELLAIVTLRESSLGSLCHYPNFNMEETRQFEYLAGI